MLYHWSPVARRKGILHDGLCPGKRGQLADWNPPYVCFCRFPNTAWALSATHSGKAARWDLWATWSDNASPYTTMNNGVNPKAKWWMTEYRCHHRIPKSKIWHVGTRTFKPRNQPKL
jgi:hypothetical protein